MQGRKRLTRVSLLGEQDTKKATEDMLLQLNYVELWKSSDLTHWFIPCFCFLTYDVIINQLLLQWEKNLVFD